MTPLPGGKLVATLLAHASRGKNSNTVMAQLPSTAITSRLSLRNLRQGTFDISYAQVPVYNASTTDWGL